MAPTLRIDTRDPRPIWRQIEEGITRWVATGTLVAGAAVPSVRDMARELRVNPATVSKAYQRLVDGGLLETRRGEGTFVCEGPPELTRAERRQQLVEAATHLAAVAAALGATRAESVAALDAARARLEAGHEEEE